MTNKVEPGELLAGQRNVNLPPSKWKTLGVALAIILGIGGLAVAGIGLSGYLQAGAFNSLSHAHSITMIAVGGIGGIAFLIMGIVGCVKYPLFNQSHQPDKKKREATEISSPSGSATSAQDIPPYIFGEACWKKHFGDIGLAPPLPLNIQDILDSPSPYHREKTVKETHILVLIPETLNGTPLSFERVHKLLPEGFYGEIAEMNNTANARAISIDPIPVTPSHWALMTPEPVPASLGQHAERGLLTEFYDTKGAADEYRRPPIRDASICILMFYYARNHQRLFENVSIYCSERGRLGSLLVGPFNEKGLHIACSDSTITVQDQGVAVYRRL